VNVVAALALRRQADRCFKEGPELEQQVFEVCLWRRESCELRIFDTTVQKMRRLLRTKLMVRRAKSHRVGPKDSCHWMPNTVSYKPN
jgi:hypothetical protein